MDANQLKRYMSLYDEVGLGTPQMSEATGGIYGGPVKISDPNRNNSRVFWAMQQLQRDQDNEMPDFFGQGGGATRERASYVQPQRQSVMNPFEGRAMQLNEGGENVQGQATNHLARFFMPQEKKKLTASQPNYYIRPQAQLGFDRG